MCVCVCEGEGGFQVILLKYINELKGFFPKIRKLVPLQFDTKERNCTLETTFSTSSYFIITFMILSWNM